MVSVTPKREPIWVLVPQAVASMVSYLSLANPGMLPIIIKPRTSRLGMAIFASLDSLDMLLSCCSLKRDVLPSGCCANARKPHGTLLCCRPLSNEYPDCDCPPGEDTCLLSLATVWGARTGCAGPLPGALDDGNYSVIDRVLHKLGVSGDSQLC